MFKKPLLPPIIIGAVLTVAFSSCVGLDSDTRYSNLVEPTRKGSGISRFACPAASGEQTSGALLLPESEPSATSETNHETRPLGLTNNHKAGKPRPRSQLKVGTSNAKVNPDGSWSYYTKDNQTFTINADGTWNYKKGAHREVTLYADSSWEDIEQFGDSLEKVHVNSDGTWKTQVEKTSQNMKSTDTTETYADGTWKSEHKKTNGKGQTVLGKPDGRVTDADTGKEITDTGDYGLAGLQEQKDPLDISWELFPRYGVGGNSVIPLERRIPLPFGKKTSRVKAGSEEERRGIADLALGDNNKAGKPRPRMQNITPHSETYINEDGSWTYDSKSQTEIIAADGTWEQKEKGNIDRSILKADGSWQSYASGEDVRVNPDGSWSRNKTGYSNSQLEVYANGAWCYRDTRNTVYKDPDGSAYEYIDRKWVRTDLHKILGISNLDLKNAKIPTIHNSYGGKGVMPLKARTPLDPGQKAYSG